MTVRSLISTLGLAAALLLGSVDVACQPSGKVARIGYLSPLTVASDAENRESFRQGLRALGYEEGKNLLLEARYAGGDLERLSVLAAEIARLKPDVIVAATTPAVRAVQQVTRTIPVVMAFSGDPVGDGLVASLAQPGGNTTGFSAAVSEIAGKRVEYLHAVVPKASQFVLLATPTASASMVSASERAGQSLGVQVNTVRISNPSDVSSALSGGSLKQAGGVIVDLAIRRNVGQIFEMAAKHRLPTISGTREFAVDGGLLAYFADYPDLFHRSATYVDKILRGTKPADLPVQQPTKFRLVVNLKTAKVLGLTIPPSLLTRADELIE